MNDVDCMLMGCMWDPFGQFCTEAGCWNYFDQSSCDGAANMGLGCKWVQEPGFEWCEEVGCWSYWTQGDCEAANCTWDGSYCYEAGCWGYGNQPDCEDELDDLDCGWQGWGWCEENKTCWDYNTQGSCEGDPECAWDPEWDYCYEEGCWMWQNESNCNTSASCNWYDGGWCQEPSCWDITIGATCNGTLGCAWETGNLWCADKGCWHYDDPTDCQDDSLNMSEVDCKWDSDWEYCYEQGCWDHSDNQTACNATEGCDWEGWCYEKGCWSYWNDSECDKHNATPENCAWDAEYGYCYERGCWDYSDNQTNCTTDVDGLGLNCTWDDYWNECYELGCWHYDDDSDGCNTSANCAWKEDEYGGWCEYQGCWDYGDNTTCNLDDKCEWETYCYKQGCWDYYDEITCTVDLDCAWDFNGYYCYEPGCWDYDYTSESKCEDNDAGLNCVWDDQWDHCYEKGCWDYDAGSCPPETCIVEGDEYCHETGCWNYYKQEDCLADSGCVWDYEWSYCYEPGCWDYDNEGSCTTAGCEWDDYWDNCYEKGCWNYDTGSACNNSSLNCKWDGYCYEEGCWSYYDTNSCVTNNCTWQNSSWCEKTGCWDYSTKDKCVKDTNCEWDGYGDYCYEKGCWDYNNKTKCNADSKCTWADSGGWCEDTGVKCWEFDYDEFGCTNATGCVWDDTWKYCYEKGCWDYDNAGECNVTANCQWQNDSWGWCEQKGCWDFDNDGASCNNSSKLIGVNCTWDAPYCYEPMKSCSDFGTMAACIDTFWCVWVTGACQEPSTIGVTHEKVAPGCWIFNNQGDKCNVTTDNCTWDAGTSTCTGDEVICAGIDDSDLCNNIPALPTCCKWVKGNCTQDNLSMKCYENLAMPPEGAAFCDDYNAIGNEQMCNKIAGYPWYMPCKWDDADQECRFNFEDVVGVGAEFEDITTRSSCEYAGGTWIEEIYCNNAGNEIPTGWCEMKIGLDAVSCDDACWACEFNGTYTNGTARTWLGQQAAKDACSNSRLGLCEWRSDGNAPYTWVCEMSQEAKAGGAVDCDSDCMACDMVGSTMEDRKKACRESKADCKWFTDPMDPSKGWCDEKGKKQCSDECAACEDQYSCQNTGEGTPGSCKWDDKSDTCAPATFYGEICSDGVDNDNNGMMDCDDPMCVFDPLCGGAMMSDCPMYPSNKTCQNGTDCIWVIDNFGNEWCDMKGANCWLYGEQGTCDPVDGCKWQSMGVQGWCDINITKADICFVRNSKQACTGNCTWIEDEYSPTGGWCEYKMFICWDKDQSACKQDANCKWASTEHGSWCEPKCFSPAYQKNATCSADEACSWITGWCEPEMTMEDCIKYDGNETGCDERPECVWFPAMGEHMCGINHSIEMACMDRWNQTACTNTPGCAWMYDPRNPEGGWCGFAMFQCGMLYGDFDESGCSADANCSWVEGGGMGPGPMGPHCEPKCFDPTISKANCTATDGCTLMTGFCNPAMMADMFKGGMDMAPPVPLGGDENGCGPESGDAGMSAYADICGFGLKDEPDVFNIVTGVSSLVDAAICNGKQTLAQSAGPGMGAMDTVASSGEKAAKFYWYLDTDGSKTGNCKSHDEDQDGFEFFLRYKGEWTDTGLAETQKAYKCDGGSWKAMDSALSGWNDLMCKVGSGMVAIKKGDLSKHTDLYDITKDIRIYAATADETGDEYNPTDTVGPSIYIRGSVDFRFEDCMVIGMDMDGDGLTAENDPDCQEFFKKGYISLEEGPMCKDNIDNDNNGYRDCGKGDCGDESCADPNCKYDDAYCPEGYTFESPDPDDKIPPSVVWKNVDRFNDAAFVMYDTDEPANGTLSFYGVNNSTCRGTPVATILDWPMENTPDITDDFKTWHDAPLDSDMLGYALSNNTTYYYSLTVCDPTGNCAYSACLDFTTKLTESEFVVDFKFKGLEGLSVKLGGNDLTGCGRMMSYADGKDKDLEFKNTAAGWGITLGGIDMTGTVSETWRDISEAFIVDNKTISVDGEETITKVVGIYSDVFKKIMASGVVPESITLRIPVDGDVLVHCDDEGKNCKEVDGATWLEGDGTYSIWEVPLKAGQTFSVFGVVSSVSGDGDGDGVSPGGGPDAVAEETPVMIPVLKIEKQVITSVKVGVPATAKFSKVDVSEITFTLKADAKDVEIEVSKLGANPADTDPSGTSYGYMNINTKNLNSADIDSATIQFKVKNSWLEDNNMDPATVKLNRYASDKWNELTTTKADEDSRYSYFDADTPGFSYFAITGEPDTAKEDVVETATPVGTAVTVSATPPTPKATPTPPPAGMDMALIGGAVAVIVVVILVIVSVLYKEQLMEMVGKKESGEGKQEISDTERE